MFAAVSPLLILLAAAVVYVRADPDPTEPAPGDVFYEGQPCKISWNPDPTGIWRVMIISLMTGDNFNMITLGIIATVDGTTPNNSYSFTCPQVTPHAPIYFYQFSSPDSPNKTWTGRFTITDSASDTVAPDHSTQPDGENIPWGIGSLVNNGSSSATPPVPSASGISVAGASTYSTPSISPGSPSTLASDTSTSALGVVSPTTAIASGASATPTGVSTTGANGAASTLSMSNIVFQTGLALALAAFGFTMML